MNYKGLLATNPDLTIARAKPAYSAAQNVFAIFDDTLARIDDFSFTTTSLRGLALTGYQSAAGAQIVAVWFNDAPPGDANGPTRVGLTLPRGRFTEPVLVDLLTGLVHALPADAWTQRAEGTTFSDLPVYDSPVLIAEKGALRFSPVPR